MVDCGSTFTVEPEFDPSAFFIDGCTPVALVPNASNRTNPSVVRPDESVRADTVVVNNNPVDAQGTVEFFANGTQFGTANAGLQENSEATVFTSFSVADMGFSAGDTIQVTVELVNKSRGNQIVDGASNTAFRAPASAASQTITVGARGAGATGRGCGCSSETAAQTCTLRQRSRL